MTETRFLDDLARALAQPMPRRRALRLLGGTLVALGVPGLAPGDALGAVTGPEHAARSVRARRAGESRCAIDELTGKPLEVRCKYTSGSSLQCCSIRSPACCPTPNAEGQYHCCETEAQCCGRSCCRAGDVCRDGACVSCARARRCGSTCCKQGETCKQGTCCRPSRVCGSTCCGPGQTCKGGRCRCSDPAQESCGSKCCPRGSFCCNAKQGICCTKRNGSCCGDRNQVCCEGTDCCPQRGAGRCCPRGERCGRKGTSQGQVTAGAESVCCPPERLVPLRDGGVCCPPGYVSLGGKLVVPSGGGGGLCCAEERVCGSGAGITCCASNPDLGIDQVCEDGRCVDV